MTPTPTMDSVLDSAFDETPTAPDTTPAVDDTPAPEPDEPPVPESDDEPVVGDEDEQADPEIDAQDNKYRVSKGRMEKFTNASKFQEAISEYVPSVEAARELYETASDFNTMALDFRNPLAEVEGPNGTPVRAIDAFMDHWHGTSPDGMAALATRILPYMAAKNPAIVQQVEGQVQSVLINRAYNAAKAAEAQAPGSEAAKAALYKAQTLDYGLNGKFRFKSVAEMPANQQQQVDPLRQREQAQQQREQQFENSQWNMFSQQNVEGAKTRALEGTVDKALEIVKDKFSPKVLGSMRNSILAEAQQALKQQNFEWHRNHGLEEQDIQREFRQALRTGQRTQVEPRVKALVADYQTRLSRIVPSIARGYINDATASAVASNRQTHQKLATGAAQKLPSGNGRPANRAPSGKFTSIEQGLDALLG